MASAVQGSHNGMKFMFHVFILWRHAFVSDAFDVTVPKTAILGIHSHSIILGCSFNAIGDFSLEHFVINWQRTENNEVVHSYHYGKDQLGQQSKQYSGRTSLFPGEFNNGNVSLKLDGLRVEDAGQYMCYISSTMGSAKGTVSLTVAAYYKEPDLLIKLQSSSVTFVLTSQGYPKASVFWQCAEDVLFKPDVLFAETEDGLYSLQSTLEVANTQTSCNVEIHNHLVNQTIIRKFNLFIPLSGRMEVQMYIWIVLGLLLLISAALIILNMWLNVKKQHKLQNKIMSSLKKGLDPKHHPFLFSRDAA
ncbi:CD276 antigen-like isoform X2 [Rhinoraja longicauda]